MTGLEFDDGGNPPSAPAVGPISGGAFNPAVALGAMVMGRFSWTDIWIYAVATIVGGAVAAIAFVYAQPGEKLFGNLGAAETE